MATLSFSIPDDVSEAFERMFKEVDHSALISDLMRKAVAESEWRALRSSLDSGERGKPVWLDKLPESHSSIVGRRAELMAELFLQDLGATFVAKPEPDIGYDFYMGFQNPRGGINNYGVQVKATEQTVPAEFPLKGNLYKSLAYSNIPALLLVANVKQNKLYYGWVNPAKRGENENSPTEKIALKEIDDATKNELRQALLNQ